MDVISPRPTVAPIGMFRASVFVSLGGALSLVLGFAAQVVTAWIYGTSAQMDAFMTAIVIPTYIESLLFIGLPFVLVPMFTKHCVAGKEDEAWGLVGVLLRTSVGITFVLAVVAAIFGREIIALTAPGLPHNSSILAGRMLSILVFGLPFAVAGTLANGVQNSRGDFLKPAVAPAVGALCNVLVVLLSYKTLGALSLAWGSVCAVAVQGCVSAIPVAARSWNRSIPLGDQRLRDVIWLIAPVVVFGTVGRATPVMERFFAASLPSGSISYLGYGAKIGMIVQALLGTAIATAAFPAMARSFSADGIEGLTREYHKVMRITWGCILPIVAIWSACALPLVQTLFVRGSFTTAAAEMTATIIPFLMGTAFCNILGSNIGRALYVQGRTLGFNFFGAAVIALYPLLAWLLVPKMGYVGLALAGLLVNLLGVAAGYCLLWNVIHFDALLAFRYCGCAVVSSVGSVVVRRLTAPLGSPLACLVLSAFTGLAIYCACLMFVDRSLLNHLGSHSMRLIRRLDWGSANAS